MKTIHKFTIDPKPGVQHIEVRKGSKLLKVAVQDGFITFWYEVDTYEPTIYIHFLVYATGQELDKGLHHKAQFIDTLLFHGGSYVLHVYKVAESASC